MGRSCAICCSSLGTVSTAYLCAPCYQQLPRSSLALPSGGSLYRYEGEMRRLILRAKVEGDSTALVVLRRLFLTSPALAVACAAVEQIIPVPSSLWGRLRGRIDIPWFLASDAAERFKLSLIAAPKQLYWRLNKRAYKGQRQRGYTLQFPQGEASIPTLLIDDIVTTGYTLTYLSSRLISARCSFFTLAEAFSEPLRKQWEP